MRVLRSLDSRVATGRVADCGEAGVVAGRTAVSLWTAAASGLDLAACQKSKTKHLAALVRVAMETGLRKSELLGLTWPQLDMTRGIIRLEVTKSGRRREVPMRQVVYDILAARPEPHTGRVWPKGDIRTAFENAVVAAGIKDFRWHDLRHHFASWFVMRGGNIQTLQKVLGHQTLTMTLKYAHLAPGFIRDEMVKTAAEAPTVFRSAEIPTAAPATQEVSLLTGPSPLAAITHAVTHGSEASVLPLLEPLSK